MNQSHESDVEAAVKRAVAGGGKILTAPTDVGSRGVMAVIASPDRAIIALLQTRDGDPAERKPVLDGWLWNELWTNDVDGASAFYGQLADLDAEDAAAGGGQNYRLLKSGDSPRVGILPNPFEGELPVWVNYIRVEDPAAITAQVPALGGTVIVDARPRSIGGLVAFIAGPSGAGVALQTWPIEKETQE